MGLLTKVWKRAGSPHGAVLFSRAITSHRTKTHLREVFTECGKVFTEHGKEGSQPIKTARDKAREINMDPYSPTQSDPVLMPVLSTLLAEHRATSGTFNYALRHSDTRRKEGGT